MSISTEQLNTMLAATKNNFPHFMLKEIFDQPAVIANYLAKTTDPTQKKVLLPQLDSFAIPQRLRILACGTSYHAGLWSRYFFEKWACIPTEVEIASEYRYRTPCFSSDETVLAITQSGETADTLASMRIAKSRGSAIIGFSNVEGSTITKEADATVYTQAGPEISIASTKALISQITALLLTAVYWATRKQTLDDKTLENIFAELNQLPTLLNKTLPNLHQQATELATKYGTKENMFFLGREQAFPIALEGALKVKETSYIHAEGFSLGELRHGPIAMVNKNFPSFIIMPIDDYFERNKISAEEIYAHGGSVIVLTNPLPQQTTINSSHIWTIPALWAPLQAFMMLPALQLLSYEIAVQKGNDVDNPRNLRKSVSSE